MTGRSAAVGAVFAVAVAATATPAAAAATGHEPSVRAIVMVRPGTSLPVGAAGARVVTVLRQVGAEIVTATPSQLRSLALDPRVVGITADRSGRVSGVDGGDSYDGSGVLAATAVGGRAGTPGAGAGVNVALLDTGVSDTAALNRASGRITDGVDVSHLASGGDADTSGRFNDGYGHGTFLASLIAGGRVPGSGSRALGVAPAARIVVVKVADANGQTSLSQVVAGLDWVAAHARGINVVNLALAVDRPTAGAYGPDPLTEAVEHVRAAGVVVVAAAGNQANQLGDPGMDPKALTVGAADVSSSDPAVADFSGSGRVAGISKPDVVAPGVHMLGMVNDGSTIARTHPEGAAGHGLFKGSGTSEATAVASGVVADYLSKNPGASPLQVKAAVRGAASSMGDSRAGAGLVRMVPGPGASGTVAAANESFDVDAWNSAAWTDLPGWQEHLAAMWSGPAWSAVSWSADFWNAVSWSTSGWNAVSWSAVSWSAVSWSAVSWSAVSWSAVSWSAVSWSAVTWSAVTWSAVSWSDHGWGDAA